MAGIVVAVAAPGMLDSELLGVDDKPHVGLGWGGVSWAQGHRKWAGIFFSFSFFLLSVFLFLLFVLL